MDVRFLLLKPGDQGTLLESIGFQRDDVIGLSYDDRICFWEKVPLQEADFDKVGGVFGIPLLMDALLRKKKLANAMIQLLKSMNKAFGSKVSLPEVINATTEEIREHSRTFERLYLHVKNLISQMSPVPCPPVNPCRSIGPDPVCPSVCPTSCRQSSCRSLPERWWCNPRPSCVEPLPCSKPPTCLSKAESSKKKKKILEDGKKAVETNQEMLLNELEGIVITGINETEEKLVCGDSEAQQTKNAIEHVKAILKGETVNEWKKNGGDTGRETLRQTVIDELLNAILRTTGSTEEEIIIEEETIIEEEVPTEEEETVEEETVPETTPDVTITIPAPCVRQCSSRGAVMGNGSLIPWCSETAENDTISCVTEETPCSFRPNHCPSNNPIPCRPSNNPVPCRPNHCPSNNSVPCRPNHCSSNNSVPCSFRPNHCPSDNSLYTEETFVDCKTCKTVPCNFRPNHCPSDNSLYTEETVPCSVRPNPCPSNNSLYTEETVPCSVRPNHCASDNPPENACENDCMARCLKFKRKLEEAGCPSGIINCR